MKLTNVEFITSAVNKDQFPRDNLPQIVFSGRSNVGKSSFINAMLKRKNFARVSQTPGKTRLVNFFMINKSFYFVDIPGYGYANVSKKQIADFQFMIEAYLNSPSISMTVLLLDIRRMPNEDDLLMYEYFKSMEKQVLIILTKSDKFSNNKRITQIKKIKEFIKIREEDIVIPFSKVTLANEDKIWLVIEENISRWHNE